MRWTCVTSFSSPYIYIANKPFHHYTGCVDSEQRVSFEWDEEKDLSNQEKHGVSFSLAQFAFADPKRVILEDLTHSTESEKRYFCLGEVNQGIMTVRFTYRQGHVRIFGAGYWRKGKQIYDRQNRLH